MNERRPLTKATRRQAMANGFSRYRGRVCDKHPELLGERRTANSCCVACQRDRLKFHWWERECFGLNQSPWRT